MVNVTSIKESDVQNKGNKKICNTDTLWSRVGSDMTGGRGGKRERGQGKRGTHFLWQMFLLSVQQTEHISNIPYPSVGNLLS